MGGGGGDRQNFISSGQDVASVLVLLNSVIYVVFVALGSVV